MSETLEDRVQMEEFCKAVQRDYSSLCALRSRREEIRKQLIAFCRACKGDCLGKADCEVKKAYHAVF